MYSKKFSLKAPSASFLTTKGYFGTQTSHHCYSKITLWTFSRGKFSKRKQMLLQESIHALLNCSEEKQTQLVKNPRVELKSSASQASGLPWAWCSVGLSNKCIWKGAQSDVVLITLHKEEYEALLSLWYSFGKGTATEPYRSTSRVPEGKWKVSHWLNSL